MILAGRACGLWEHKYRAGRIGHDQSILAGKSECSTDIIKRKTLGLQWSRYGLQNRADGGMMERVRVSERPDHIGPKHMNKAHGYIHVHALLDQG